MNYSTNAILPVVLAGGGGTRLWPLSRGYYPKQFLSVHGKESLLQQTLTRLEDSGEMRVEAPIVVCNEEHRFLVAEQARQVGCQPATIMLEPEGRNTAPALTAAARYAMRDGADPVLMMMPADHLIGDHTAFNRAAHATFAEAEAGRVVTFGVVPTYAETGYGYIKVGYVLTSSELGVVHALSGFREKPDEATAQSYVDAGTYLWNGGIFVMKASVWLAQVDRYCPDIARYVNSAVDEAREDGDFFRLDTGFFAKCPNDSIDYAVIEPLAAAGGDVAVVVLDAGWSDIGSWSSLWDVSVKDSDDNVLRGDVCAIDTKHSLVFAEDRLVATLGCENLVVVETADSVMVADKSRTQEVRAVVDWLSQQNREERLTHRRVYRPWGSYESLDRGARFQVKRITVNPGGALSLQLHHHRAEHWIVISGTAMVTRGKKKFSLSVNESTYIPAGTKHRLENRQTTPVELIEVQSGSYLGEDDIVRFEDRYNRIRD
ncbi:MAG: mannose-1-phosphate guanylyltransferase/mannose-6-phosphate isomerase [Pseudomonadota bacterium]|nr:mannose-1-phosphate guanylyltransferase/mannose-6-phosphate isomerase [Pseudomonadota bacterium]